LTASIKHLKSHGQATIARNISPQHQIQPRYPSRRSGITTFVYVHISHASEVLKLLCDSRRLETQSCVPPAAPLFHGTDDGTAMWCSVAHPHLTALSGRVSITLQSEFGSKQEAHLMSPRVPSDYRHAMRDAPPELANYVSNASSKCSQRRSSEFAVKFSTSIVIKYEYLTYMLHRGSAANLRPRAKSMQPQVQYRAHRN
jgi:hypothetical protein